MNKLLLLAERIKSCREGLGITQEELAEIMHVTRSTVGDWESCANSPETAKIIELAKLFGVSTDFLLGMERNAKINVDGLNSQQLSVLSDLIDSIKNT